MSDMPQFSTAEYVQPQLQRCRLCNAPLATEYYRVRGQSACAACAAKARSGQGDASGNAAFSRAVLFGIAAAIAGLAGYAAFTIATNFYVGYVALGVGYIIARAMKTGSGGLGGPRYQIVAVILTYLAIALAEIPIGLWHFHTKAPAGRLLAAGIRLLPLGLISPILEMTSPAHGLINLVILFVGLRIAWRGAAGSTAMVEGPYRLSTTS